jgi:hypothetical protein
LQLKWMATAVLNAKAASQAKEVGDNEPSFDAI